MSESCGHGMVPVPVDIDVVMRDPALVAMPDGPAKRLLHRLSTELDHDPGEAPPMLLVRRAPTQFDTNARPA